MYDLGRIRGEKNRAYLLKIRFIAPSLLINKMKT